MPLPLVTSLVTQAGVRLLDAMVSRSLECFDMTDDAKYFVLEGALQTVRDPDLIAEAVTEAQRQFAAHEVSNQRWLEALADLLEYAGDERDRLLRNLWLAYIFSSQHAFDDLLAQYPAVHRQVTAQSGQYLPTTWGEWVEPVYTFMSIVMEQLVEREPLWWSDIIQREQIQHLVEDIAEAGEPSGSDPGQLMLEFEPGAEFDQATVVAYLTACVQQVGRINQHGSSRGGMSFPLHDVYIPLRLVPLRELDTRSGYARFQLRGSDRIDEALLLRDPIERRVLEGHAGLLANDVLRQHKRVTVVGQMGAGKTTLLRHLALEHAETLLGEPDDAAPEPDPTSPYALACPLPVYIDLADFVARSQAGERLEDYIIRTTTDLVRDDGVRHLLVALMESGQCLILLDGLDQAATEEQRRMLGASVLAFIEEWHPFGNQIVVSSRSTPYALNPLPFGFVTFVIQPLNRSQINSFLLRWKLMLARAERPLIGDDEAMRHAHAETLALTRHLTASPRLHHLVNVPLLLRMLVSTYQPGMVMTPQRAGIMQFVANSLIREWQLPQTDSQQPAVLEQEVNTLLGELAFWLHSSRPDGQIGERELREMLGRAWSEIHPDASLEQVQGAVGDFLGKLRLHAGVVVEVAPQRYGFLYQGLQEYFAARYLVSSYRMAPQRIRERLHDPRWDEVIALAVGLSSLRSVEDGSDLLETAILARGERAVQFGQASSPFESLLKRDLFFAARLLGDGVDAGPDLTRRIVKQMLDLWLDGSRDSLGRIHMIAESARRHLSYLNGTPASRVALQVAAEHVREAHEYLAAYAVDALTFWPLHYQEAQEHLASIAEEAPLLVRRAVVAALGRMPQLTPTALQLLMKSTGDLDETVSERSRYVLAKLGPVPYDLLRLWLDLLRSSPDTAGPRVALRRLRDVTALPHELLSEVLQLVRHPDDLTRRLALETLTAAAALPDDIMIALARAIAAADAPDRALAVRVFARPVTLPDHVVHQLVRWSSDPDRAVREAVLDALGACSNDSKEVIGALIELANDPSDTVREKAIEPLVRKGQASPFALHLLTHLVGDYLTDLRIAIAHALRHVATPDDEIQNLLNTLLSDEHVEVRRTTLQTIVEIETPGPDIIDHVIGLAATPDHPVQLEAIQALAAQDGLPERALLVLLDALAVYGYALGDEIAACLRRHAPLTREVAEVLLMIAATSEQALSHDVGIGARMRSVALEVLGVALPSAPPGVLHALLAAVADESASMMVRLAGLRGLSATRVISPDVLNLLGILIRDGPLSLRAAAAITVGELIHSLPDPPLESDQLLEVARSVTDILMALQPRAAWEADSAVQGQLLEALSWIVARARPALPTVRGARLENPARQLY